MAYDVVIPEKIYHGPVATAVGEIYSVPADTKVMLKNITVTTTNTLSVTFTIYVVPDGDTPTLDNVVMHEVILPPSTLFQWDGTMVLDGGDSIHMVANDTGLVIYLSGGKVT